MTGSKNVQPAQITDLRPADAELFHLAAPRVWDLSSRSNSSSGRSILQVYIDGVHFDLNHFTPKDLGRKLATIVCNELAVNETVPREILVSLGVPQGISDIFVDEFILSLQKTAHEVLAKGVLISRAVSPAVFFVSIFAWGTGTSVRSFKPRTGRHRTPKVQPGYLLCLLGETGFAAAGLALLKQAGRSAREKSNECFLRQVNPPMQLSQLRKLRSAGSGVGAIELVRDGLSAAVHSLCGQAQIGARIYEDSIPIAAEVQKVAEALSFNPKWWATYGGEDYSLLFTSAPKSLDKLRSVFGKEKLFVLGEVVSKKQGIQICKSTGELVVFEKRGWNPLAIRSTKIK